MNGFVLFCSLSKQCPSTRHCEFGSKLLARIPFVTFGNVATTRNCRWKSKISLSCTIDWRRNALVSRCKNANSLLSLDIRAIGIVFKDIEAIYIVCERASKRHPANDLCYGTSDVHEGLRDIPMKSIESYVDRIHMNYIKLYSVQAS